MEKERHKPSGLFRPSGCVNPVHGAVLDTLFDFKRGTAIQLTVNGDSLLFGQLTFGNRSTQLCTIQTVREEAFTAVVGELGKEAVQLKMLHSCPDLTARKDQGMARTFMILERTFEYRSIRNDNSKALNAVKRSFEISFVSND